MRTEGHHRAENWSQDGHGAYGRGVTGRRRLRCGRARYVLVAAVLAPGVLAACADPVPTNSPRPADLPSVGVSSSAPAPPSGTVVATGSASPSPSPSPSTSPSPSLLAAPQSCVGKALAALSPTRR